MRGARTRPAGGQPLARCGFRGAARRAVGGGAPEERGGVQCVLPHGKPLRKKRREGGRGRRKADQHSRAGCEDDETAVPKAARAPLVLAECAATRPGSGTGSQPPRSASRMAPSSESRHSERCALPRAPSCARAHTCAWRAASHSAPRTARAAAARRGARAAAERGAGAASRRPRGGGRGHPAPRRGPRAPRRRPMRKAPVRYALCVEARASPQPRSAVDASSATAIVQFCAFARDEVDVALRARLASPPHPQRCAP